MKMKCQECWKQRLILVFIYFLHVNSFLFYKHTYYLFQLSECDDFYVNNLIRLYVCYINRDYVEPVEGNQSESIPTLQLIVCACVKNIREKRIYSGFWD